MSEMVEKVADALFDAFEKHGEWDELALQGRSLLHYGQHPEGSTRARHDRSYPWGNPSPALAQAGAYPTVCAYPDPVPTL